MPEEDDDTLHWVSLNPLKSSVRASAYSQKGMFITFDFYVVSKVLTAHSTTDPTPSTTQRNRNRSTTALIPPHTTSAKSSIWDYQSHKRKKALSTTKDGMDLQIALPNVSNSGSGAGGDKE